MVELIIFDVDGTLAKSSSLHLLPHVKDFFNLIYKGNCAWKPKIAIATNQGGVGMRYWMEQQKFGKPGRFPDQASIEVRLTSLLDMLEVTEELPVYVAYRYKNKLGQWSPVPPEHANSPRWQSEWRKPGPGMLLQAMLDAGVSPANAVYVGDREEDQQAAQAAGCGFIPSPDFFNYDWAGCQSLESALRAVVDAAGHKEKKWKLPFKWWH